MQNSHPHWHQAPEAEWPAKATVPYCELTEVGIIGIQTMNSSTNIQRFMVFPPSTPDSTTTLLLKVVKSAADLATAGSLLMRVAWQAHCMRDLPRLETITSALALIPLRECNLASLYYKAFCLSRRGDRSNALLLCEELADLGQHSFFAKARLSQGSLLYLQGAYEEAFEVLHEAAANSSDLATYVQTRKMQGCILGDAGYHQAATRVLDANFNLCYSVARREPFIIFEYYNSMAVEYAEVGHLEEAKRLSDFAIQSPYGPKYIEWQETNRYITERLPRKGFVSLGGMETKESNPAETEEGEAIEPGDKVILFPVAEESKTKEPAKNVIAFPAMKSEPSPTEPSDTTATILPFHRRKFALGAIVILMRHKNSTEIVFEDMLSEDGLAELRELLEEHQEEARSSSEVYLFRAGYSRKETPIFRGRISRKKVFEIIAFIGNRFLQDQDQA